MIKAVIFDCFGVVISDGLKALTLELEKTNPDARAIINYYVRLANSGQMSSSEYGEEVTSRLGISKDTWREKIANGEHRDQSVLDYIESLHGRYKTAMLSNLAKGSMSRRFSDEELSRYFDVVVISGELGVQKPDHEIYKLTAEKLGVSPEECIFTDDIERFCTAAEEVGMKSVLFDNFESAKPKIDAILASSTDN